MTTVSRLQQKRLQADVKQLREQHLNYVTAFQSEENMLNFYFLIYGQKGSDYENGQYIGKFILSDKYPFTPPDIMFLTPNGRFEINRKICLTITGYHSGEWNPLLTIHAMLIQVYSIFSDDDTTGIAHIKESKAQRIRHAQSSIEFNTTKYPDIYRNFDMTHLNDGSITTPASMEASSSI